MANGEWMVELMQRALEDKEFQLLMNDARRFAPAFQNVWQALTPEQRKQVDAYLSAHETMEGILTHFAYEPGLKHGYKNDLR